MRNRTEPTMAQNLSPVLTLDVDGSADNDYTLNDESVWITVGNISVYIKKGDEGVSVDLYPTGAENDGAIVGTYALYAEAESEESQSVAHQLVALDHVIMEVGDGKTSYEDAFAYTSYRFGLSVMEQHKLQYRYMTGGYTA